MKRQLLLSFALIFVGGTVLGMNDKQLQIRVVLSRVMMMDTSYIN